MQALIFGHMGLFDRAALAAGRARYAAAQGLRSAWYGAQMQAARRRSGGFDHPDEPDFAPSRGRPDMAVARRAYVDLFVQDRKNVEAGLYPAPQDVSLAQLPDALKSARAFQAEIETRLGSAFAGFEAGLDKLLAEPETAGAEYDTDRSKRL